MLERDSGEWTVTCDGCSNFEHLSADTFDEAVDELKTEDFQPVRRGGDWEHFCACCVEDGKHELGRSRMHLYRGAYYSVKDLVPIAAKHGVCEGTLKQRLQRGSPVTAAVETAPRVNGGGLRLDFRRRGVQ